MPENQMPPGWYDATEQAIFRLSSKNYVDVPIDVDGKVIHILGSHPTPPAFDTAGIDWNKRRNYDEIRLIADYITPGAGEYIYDDHGATGGLGADESFVIVGDLNADEDEGDRWEVGGVTAIKQLIDNPHINDVVPISPDWPGNGVGDADDTATFAGNMRADYVLPSTDLTIRGSQVFWPKSNDPQYAATLTSDHRLVYVDVAIDWLPGDVDRGGSLDVAVDALARRRLRWNVGCDLRHCRKTEPGYPVRRVCLGSRRVKHRLSQASHCSFNVVAEPLEKALPCTDQF
jgi:hypothetical protein